MTALTRITFAYSDDGTMLPVVAYTKGMKRLPALAVWLQAARPGNP
jgi:hypothetical protein